MTTQDILTQELLKELFIYNLEDGNLYHKVNKGKKMKAGSLVGAMVNRFSKERPAFYRETCMNKKHYFVHRLIWIYNYGFIDKNLSIDHINGNGLDNRLCNLRLVSHKENLRNQKNRSSNTSGSMGVHRHKSGKWEAQITVNGVKNYLGCYKIKEEAILARKEAEIKYGFHKNHGRKGALA